ncbi:hypothetical protein RRG08_054312, partial [Elysia crispata]
MASMGWLRRQTPSVHCFTDKDFDYKRYDSDKYSKYPVTFDHIILSDASREAKALELQSELGHTDYNVLNSNDAADHK